MQNIAEFRIIGRVGKIEIKDKVAYLDVAANYTRKVGEDWEDDTHWNCVTLFGRNVERAGRIGKGDLVHITGRVRQNSFERGDGERIYGVDLIADRFAALVRTERPGEDDLDEEAR